MKRFASAMGGMVIAALLAAGCSPAPSSTETSPGADGWHEFRGTWTAAGDRHVIKLGNERQASVTYLSGSLVLEGGSRPGAGFRAVAVVMNDSATGMVGRCLWTDEHGDQVFSELQGEGTNTANHIVGTIVGGTGRFAGATGTFEFSWRFVLQTEDGTVQGQSERLAGRVRVDSAEARPRQGGDRKP
ncbi:MAG TPA: hypothetical protein VMK32_04725 [Burkholderiaceae bacterium]|nr:hypothetical protein [Burkholderiaceae bacterium]